MHTDDRLTARIAPLCVALFVVAGCASSPDIEKAPLEESRQKKLRSTLVGTWKYLGTKETAEASPEPIQSLQVSWTFRSDGTGEFREAIPKVDKRNQRKFEWHLEGRIIVLNDVEGNDETYYRAESWSPKRMTWYNYSEENYYLLKPAD